MGSVKSESILESKLPACQEWLAGALGADNVRVCKFAKLGGGAIQENWRLDLEIENGIHSGYKSVVLRKDSPSKVPCSLERNREFSVMKFVSDSGISAPTPIEMCNDESVIGSKFFIMEHVSGIADARAIARSPNLNDFGPGIVESLGREMAKLHTIKPPKQELSFLSVPCRHPADVRIILYRKYLDELPGGRPALEFALNWLEDNKPDSGGTVLCHCDFRTGNFILQENELAAILDWEFTSWGDPYEDVGWFCARCWRFGNDGLQAGGIAHLEDFIKGYRSVRPEMELDRKAVAYWQVMAEVRWAIIALQQASRSSSGLEVSLELALTGRMAAEMELNALTTIAGIEEFANETQ